MLNRSRITYDLHHVTDMVRGQQIATAGLYGIAQLLTLQLETLMKTQQDLIDKIAELGAAESHWQDRENAIVAALQANVDKLTADAAANVPFDPQAQIDTLQGMIDAIPADVPPAVVGTATT